MSRALLLRLLPTIDRDRWTADQWRRHLLSRAESQVERDDINATFRG